MCASRRVRKKGGTSSLRHIVLKGLYMPDKLLYGLIEPEAFEYNGNKTLIFDWLPDSLAPEAEERKEHVSVLQVEQAVALLGKRVISITEKEETFYFALMGSKNACYLTRDILKSTVDVHFACRKFTSQGVGIGGADSTPPLKYVHATAKSTDYRMSLETLTWVDASTEDNQEQLLRRYAERSWEEDILGMHGDEL